MLGSIKHHRFPTKLGVAQSYRRWVGRPTCTSFCSRSISRSAILDGRDSQWLKSHSPPKIRPVDLQDPRGAGRLDAHRHQEPGSLRDFVGDLDEPELSTYEDDNFSVANTSQRNIPRDEVFAQAKSNPDPGLIRFVGGETSGGYTVKERRALPYTTDTSEFLFGYNMCRLAMEAERRKAHQLYIYQGVMRNSNTLQREKILVGVADKFRIPIKDTTDVSLLDAMSKGRPHNGFVLEAEPIRFPQLEYLGTVDPDTKSCKSPIIHSQSYVEIKSKEPGRRYPFVLILDELLDGGNLGAILRSAHYLGVDAVIHYIKNSSPPTAVTSRTSAGALEVIDIYDAQQLAGFIESSKKNGWHFYAAMPLPSERTLRHTKAKKAIRYFDLKGLGDPLKSTPVALVLGNEGEGLRPSIEGLMNYNVTIASAPDTNKLLDSLNVGVATTLIAHRFLNAPPGAEALRRQLVDKKLERKLQAKGIATDEWTDKSNKLFSMSDGKYVAKRFRETDLTPHQSYKKATGKSVPYTENASEILYEENDDASTYHDDPILTSVERQDYTMKTMHSTSASTERDRDPAKANVDTQKDIDDGRRIEPLKAEADKAALSLESHGKQETLPVLSDSKSLRSPVSGKRGIPSRKAFYSTYRKISRSRDEEDTNNTEQVSPISDGLKTLHGFKANSGSTKAYPVSKDQLFSNDLWTDTILKNSVDKKLWNIETSKDYTLQTDKIEHSSDLRKGESNIENIGIDRKDYLTIHESLEQQVGKRDVNRKKTGLGQTDPLQITSKRKNDETLASDSTSESSAIVPPFQGKNGRRQYDSRPGSNPRGFIQEEDLKRFTGTKTRREAGKKPSETLKITRMGFRDPSKKPSIRGPKLNPEITKRQPSEDDEESETLEFGDGTNETTKQHLSTEEILEELTAAWESESDIYKHEDLFTVAAKLDLSPQEPPKSKRAVRRLAKKSRFEEEARLMLPPEKPRKIEEARISSGIYCKTSEMDMSSSDDESEKSHINRPQIEEMEAYWKLQRLRATDPRVKRGLSTTKRSETSRNTQRQSKDVFRTSDEPKH